MSRIDKEILQSNKIRNKQTSQPNCGKEAKDIEFSENKKQWRWNIVFCVQSHYQSEKHKTVRDVWIDNIKNL